MNAISLSIAQRLANAIDIIKLSGVEYLEFGLFGSVARGDYNGCSDMDIAIVTEHPMVSESFTNLRLELENIGCDVANITEEHLNNPITAFHKNVNREYRRVCYDTTGIDK